MATPRFFLPPPDWRADEPKLTDEEAHHCLDVMRCREGDRVSLFDGEGREAEAEIVEAKKGNVTLRTFSVTESPRPAARLTLGQAIPKGKNMELIIQKATELGVSTLVPLVSERTVVRLDEREREKKRRKWQRVAVEACKQCGQNWLPTVETPATVEEFARGATDPFRLVAAIAPEARPLKAILRNWEARHGERPSAATLLIGPEGDLTPREVATATDAGFAPLTLGPIVLRSETAAIYTLSVTGHELRNE